MFYAWDSQYSPPTAKFAAPKPESMALERGMILLKTSPVTAALAPIAERVMALSRACLL